MKFLIDFLAGMIAMLAAAALSQFGIDLQRSAPAVEITKLPDCAPPETGSTIVSTRRCE